MNDINSLSYSKWRCQYHAVELFVFPKSISQRISMLFKILRLKSWGFLAQNGGMYKTDNPPATVMVTLKLNFVKLNARLKIAPHKTKKIRQTRIRKFKKRGISFMVYEKIADSESFIICMTGFGLCGPLLRQYHTDMLRYYILICLTGILLSAMLLLQCPQKEGTPWNCGFCNIFWR